MLAVIFNDKPALYSMMGGLALLYIAGQAAMDALLKRGQAGPGKRAIAYWLPVAATAIVAGALNRNDIAIAILFATSVASLALASGAALWLAPATEIPAIWRRMWMFILPVAILSFLCGFSGMLTWRHAGFFIVEGLALLNLYMAREKGELPAAKQAGDARSSGLRIIEFILGIVLASLGGWLVVRTTIHTAETVRVLSGGVIATIVLGPGLLLAAIGSATTLASEGRSAETVSSNVAMVLLNLCLLLPIVIAMGYFVPGIGEMARLRSTTMPVDWWAMIQAHATATIFPMNVWRLDNVVLIILGMLLIPVGAGRWMLGRREGVAMVIGYALYLLIAVALAARL